MAFIDPLYTLRKNIREARKQYRHASDNSPSLFHPAKGFVLGYDMAAVEAALNQYEEVIATEYLAEVK